VNRWPTSALLWRMWVSTSSCCFSPSTLRLILGICSCSCSCSSPQVVILSEARYPHALNPPAPSQRNFNPQFTLNGTNPPHPHVQIPVDFPIRPGTYPHPCTYHVPITPSLSTHSANPSQLPQPLPAQSTSLFQRFTFSPTVTAILHRRRCKIAFFIRPA
jgi:hypothetical protein